MIFIPQASYMDLRAYASSKLNALNPFEFLYGFWLANITRIAVIEGRFL